ncbi:hypothetical protein [Pseudanabaena mucicola]|nr:hypothetical protein [Pseudanabaena mucicola]
MTKMLCCLSIYFSAIACDLKNGDRLNQLSEVTIEAITKILAVKI